MAFQPKRNIIVPKIICDKCQDVGSVIGMARRGDDESLIESWTEVCPYCMPTNKYGNLQEKLRLAEPSDLTGEQIDIVEELEILRLEYKNNTPGPNEDEWGND